MRVFLFLLAFIFLAAPTMAAEKDRKIIYWYDPMAPGQKFDKPGKSPYMDMDLVPMYADEPPEHDNAANLTINSQYQQALGVRTAPAGRYDFGMAVHAPGTVVPETSREHIVSVRTGGWITDLKAAAVGDVVRKGDLLFTFYSQELAAAESDFMHGSRIGNAGERLRLYGMDDKAIAELVQKGHFLSGTPFYAPANGTVTKLNVRKGSYLDTMDNRNTVVLTLQDFSRVWVEAHVPVKDLQFLSAGTPATVTVDETGRSYNTTVETILPMTDMESRKGVVRLVLDNADGGLKTGSLVTVMFNAASQARLAVPAEAILYGKSGGHVVKALSEERFVPVIVETGITAHGMTEILSGIKEGDMVVTSGQFLIDAEASLRGGLANMSEKEAPNGSGDEERGHVH